MVNGNESNSLMSNDETKSRPPLAEPVAAEMEMATFFIIHHPSSKIQNPKSRIPVAKQREQRVAKQPVAKQSSSSSSIFSRKSADDGRLDTGIVAM